jgi:hypothetical protein
MAKEKKKKDGGQRTAIMLSQGAKTNQNKQKKQVAFYYVIGRSQTR